MSESKRLFFAIELPDATRQEVVRWRAEHFPQDAGRPVAAANLHLTLAFLGEVSAEKQRALETLAGRIRQPGFTLQLDDAGQWLRSRVVWLGCRQSPRGLLQLADMLRAQAARSGCWQSPTPFHPHITLLRDASHAVTIPPPGFHWTFPVTEFVLYESQFAGGRLRYTALNRWTLKT
ncbi:MULTISPECIES: RNA 2',3'-cyclic phosphodiesterase [Enterobacteriaceae]|jgi:2'-5' RNA ligase|uniref:RNA 2',3'-cyclic phosphodiesterase n=1 Tax=Enterobacteriaceae TaxID=543 RepID=UPI00057C209B|nr:MULTISPECIES: RNA 2',3'-cyclic phosphodiesterase [Enterobacteriaceae]MBS6736706.1 RNA 2',3'-cyclic phosphodiesterase [Enterobacteriaceae bacterium]PTA92227.1 RNA 2',3'-cyclic phosphodiesterase [Kluyvera sp. Nf5]PXW59251.1 2'-5' RNA ligase [Grimontella sp. AG753]QIH65176.1 RNA 2',3'-cyclic phosphodiesterase [Enterobacteriaceae bacterium A-F18]MBY6259419.1 RNA 2',3'-cyclic phosphodiesterase [Phytobacter diazotrophicus]